MKIQIAEQEWNRSKWGEQSIKSKLIGYNKFGTQITLIIEESGYDLSDNITKHLKDDVEMEITFKTTETITKTHTLA